MRPFPLRLPLVAAALAASLTACSSLVADLTGAPGPDQSAGADTAPAAEAEAPASTSYPRFGFVHAVDAEAFPAVVILDDAEWFEGPAAESAARADHGDAAEVPNGFYIRNGAPETAEYATVDNVVIVVPGPDGADQVLTPQEWEERIRAQASGEGAWYEPYHLTFNDAGELVEARAQYLP